MCTFASYYYDFISDTMYASCLCSQDLDEAIKLAGFSKTSIVGEMHAFRANDPRENDIAEGHNPIQVCLHLWLLVVYVFFYLWLSF